MLKNQKFNNIIVIIGVIFIIIGIGLLTNNYFQSKVLKAYNQMNLQLLALNDEEEILVPNVNSDTLETEKQETIVDDNSKKENNKNNSKPKIEYIASLSIPKISLNQGLTAINSKYNSVNYGIEVIKGSTYPTVKNGNLILASHSGTSYRSIFKNLYKLEIGDICSVYYEGKTYKYKITNIYNKPKIGKIAISRDYNKTTLTLITCTKNSDTEQTVYIAELI